MFAGLVPAGLERRWEQLLGIRSQMCRPQSRHRAGHRYTAMRPGGHTHSLYPLSLNQSSVAQHYLPPPTPKCSAVKGPLLFSGGWERRISPGGVLQPVISPRPRLISAIRLLTGLTGLQRAGGAGDQVTLSPDSEQSLHQHSPHTQCTSIFLLWSSLR